MLRGHGPGTDPVPNRIHTTITAPYPCFRQDAVSRYWRVIAIIKYIVSIVGIYTCGPSSTPILVPGYRRPGRIAFRGLPRPNHVMVASRLNNSSINQDGRSRVAIGAECGLCVPEARCRSRQMQVSRPPGLRMSCAWSSRASPSVSVISTIPNRQAAFGPAPPQPPIHQAGAGPSGTRIADQAGLRDGEKRR